MALQDLKMFTISRWLDDIIPRASINCLLRLHRNLFGTQALSVVPPLWASSQKAAVAQHHDLCRGRGRMVVLPEGCNGREKGTRKTVKCAGSTRWERCGQHYHGRGEVLGVADVDVLVALQTGTAGRDGAHAAISHRV
ncbi:hypothetical protein MTO96_028187 [Rhipicephalus appendiculatus]